MLILLVIQLKLDLAVRIHALFCNKAHKGDTSEIIIPTTTRNSLNSTAPSEVLSAGLFDNI